MIKFLAKFRASLVARQDLRKYLLYAIGEIVLVVIGILIALQINIKSQHRTNRNQIESILRNALFKLESDMSNPVLGYIEFVEYKDSLNNLVLNNTLTYADYEPSRNTSRGLTKLMEYEFEPFQFESQAYDRLISNMEIIPEEYMYIVEMLQDVYNKEALVVNEVAVELKNFVDEIEDKYQTNYSWYSDTDTSHFRQKVDYMISSQAYLNDVKRHQNIVNHLHKHLSALRTYVSIAYSGIYNELAIGEPFSDIVDHFYFPDSGELDEYVGKYSMEADTTEVLEIKTQGYYLTDQNRAIRLISAGADRFTVVQDQRSYAEYVRDESNQIVAIKLVMTSRGEVRLYKKIR
jgi:hypothetical protein